MKKWGIMILCLMLALALTGCAGKSKSVEPEVETSTEESSAEPEESSEAAEESVEESSEEPEDGIDVDLTELSSTMVYGQLFEIMAAPDEYRGKTIKIKGQFSYFYDESEDQEYFACVVQDATACCAQGIEFVLAGDHTYPDDYPELDSEICVVGVYDTYQVGKLSYCTLRDAEFVEE